MGMYKFPVQKQKREHSHFPCTMGKMVSLNLYHSPLTFSNNTPSVGCYKFLLGSAYHWGVCEKPKTLWQHRESTKRDCNFTAEKNIGEYLN